MDFEEKALSQYLPDAQSHPLCTRFLFQLNFSPASAAVPGHHHRGDLFCMRDYCFIPLCSVLGCISSCHFMIDRKATFSLKADQLGDVFTTTCGWDFHIKRRGVVFHINTESTSRHDVALPATPHQLRSRFLSCTGLLNYRTSSLQVWKFERADIKKMRQDEKSSEKFLLQLTSETSKRVESVDVGDSAHFRRRVNTAGDAHHIPREWRG